MPFFLHISGGCKNAEEGTHHKHQTMQRGNTIGQKISSQASKGPFKGNENSKKTITIWPVGICTEKLEFKRGSLKV